MTDSFEMYFLFVLKPKILFAIILFVTALIFEADSLLQKFLSPVVWSV